MSPKGHKLLQGYQKVSKLALGQVREVRSKLALGMPAAATAAGSSPIATSPSDLLRRLNTTEAVLVMSEARIASALTALIALKVLSEPPLSRGGSMGGAGDTTLSQGGSMGGAGGSMHQLSQRPPGPADARFQDQLSHGKSASPPRDSHVQRSYTEYTTTTSAPLFSTAVSMDQHVHLQGIITRFTPPPPLRVELSTPSSSPPLPRQWTGGFYLQR
jgi:hypothetical protein